MPQLEYLDVSKQKSENSIGLSGDLPRFNQAPRLREVYLQDNDFSNDLPPDFLAATSSDSIVVDLRRNRLSGAIPVGLQRFTNGVFLFADNEITEVPGPLCSLGWNDQPSGSTSCDYVLCPVGTFSALGRATADLTCAPCPSATFAGTSGCGDNEREVLKDLFYGMEGSQWLHNDGWGSHTSVCSWYGVTCENGLVVKLDLRGNNIVGTLSSRIWELTEMTELDLSDNNIVVESFEGVGNAARLETIKLSNNQVNTLDGIGSVNATLKNFHCTSCDIYTPFPQEFFTLSNLEKLYLNYNHISGPATGFGALNKLTEIYLFSNLLTGELPTPQFGSRFAEVISIGHNRFNGTIPTSYNQLFNLRVFSAEYEGLAYLPVDEEYQVRDHGLIGTLPSFSFCSQVQEVYLAGNAFGGAIPSDFLLNADVSAPIHVDISSVSHICSVVFASGFPL